MKVPTGIRKKESERRKILWKNMKLTLLIDPPFQCGDNFSRLGLSHTDRSFTWCYFWCICSKYMQQRSSFLRLVKTVLSSYFDIVTSNGFHLCPYSPLTFIPLVFSHLKRGSHLLLPRIWINLRLSLLFLRHPLASYKGICTSL